MGLWAGYLGSGSESALRCLLGNTAQIRTGAGYGIGVRDSHSAHATLTVTTSGCLTVATGTSAEAGSSATVNLCGPTLNLRCDPFGLHGVYVAQVGSVTWAASDPRLLLQLPGVSSRLDPAALYGYLCFSYVPKPLTLIAGVTSLPAGARMTIRPDGTRQCVTDAAWCELPTLDLPEEDAIAELRQRMQTAVARQVGNEREVGVYLSGGLDSSLIAALLVRLGVHVHLYTLDFGPPYNREMPYAQRVASHLDRKLTVVAATPSHVRSALVETASALYQPFGDSVTTPLYLLGQAAARKVAVVFNGEGGDQLFGGWTNKPLIAAEVYGRQGYDREQAYLQTYHRFYGLEDHFFAPAARAAVTGLDVGEWVRPALNVGGFTSLLHRLRAANLWLKGAQNIAPRVTQLGAAHGLRMCTPFFDRDLAEWTFALPPEWFLRGACEKFLLKRAADPFLPPSVVWREKQGMGVPATEWCLGPLRQETARWLNPRILTRNGWFVPSAVSALRRGDDHPGEYRSRRIGEKLWTLLMLHMWCDVQGQPMDWPTATAPVGLFGRVRRKLP